MKIISYNVNGIRAAFKKDFIGWLASAKPDVLCLQETKAQEEQVDVEAIEKTWVSPLLVFCTEKGVQWSRSNL